MKFLIDSEDNARAVLAYYADFHDSLVKSVRIVSRDQFVEEAHDVPGQEGPCLLVTGFVDIEIAFASPFVRGASGEATEILARFWTARDLYIDYRLSNGSFSTWSPSKVLIEACENEQAARGDGRWRFSVIVNVCSPEKIWVPREAIAFLFKEAEFTDRSNHDPEVDKGCR